MPEASLSPGKPKGADPLDFAVEGMERHALKANAILKGHLPSDKDRSSLIRRLANLEIAIRVLSSSLQAKS